MNNKLRNILLKTAACAALAFSAVTAQAAIITLNPLNAVVTEGDTFNVSIVGQDFFDGTIGGGFSLAWDPGILTLQSYSLTFSGDQTFGTPGVLDLAAGTLSNADVTSLNGTTDPNFEIALVTFSADAAGLSPADVSIGLFSGGTERIWANATGFVDVDPTFIGGTVEVVPAVPVPAAVWLFGSGLLGLIGIARKKASATTA